jgi:hypothetical protein
MSRVIAFGLALMTATPAAALADEILLRSGGRLVGEVVERHPEAVVVEADGGQITLSSSQILRIIPGPTPLSRYRERAAALPAGDVQGWLALALWARDESLGEPARQSFERVLALEPDNAAANQALGKVRLGGRWLTVEQSYRARGYVSFEGRWMRPQERAALVRERQAEEELEHAARARAAAEAAAQEAEARVRAAEARAQEAMARAQAAEIEAARRRTEERFRCSHRCRDGFAGCDGCGHGPCARRACGHRHHAAGCGPRCR